MIWHVACSIARKLEIRVTQKCFKGFCDKKPGKQKTSA
jgi:hypothetical protein